MLIDIIAQSFIVFLFTLLFYTTGKILLNIFSKNLSNSKYTNLFFATLLGIIFYVCAYSILKTRGLTINIMFIFLAIPVFMPIKKINIKCFSLRYNLGSVVELFLLSIFFTLFFNFAFESKIIQADSIYYLKIAEGLKMSGHENRQHLKNLYVSNFNGVEAYHYFEMWLAAFIMQLTNVFFTTFSIFRIITQSILFIVLILGLLAIVEQLRNKIKIFDILFVLAFALFFIPDFFEFFPSIATFFKYSVETNPFLRPNFRTYWIFLILSVLFILRRNHSLFVFSLLLLPLISITTALPIYGALFLLLLINTHCRFLKETDNLKLWMTFIGSVVFVVVFISYFKINNIESYYNISISEVLNYFKTTYKAILYMICIVTLHVAITFGIFFSIIYLFSRRNLIFFIRQYRLLLLFSFLLLIAGIVSFQLCTFMSNTYQFAFISYIQLSLLLFIYIYSEKLELNPTIQSYWVSKLILFFYLSVCAYWLYPYGKNILFSSMRAVVPKGIYSEKYLIKIDSLIESKQISFPGAYIGDSLYYKNMYYSHRMPDLYFPFSFYYLSSKYSGAYEFCLTNKQDFFYKLSTGKQNMAYLKYMVNSTPFNLYSMMNDRRDKSYFYLRNKFLEENHISFLVITSHTQLDELILNRSYGSIIDEKSGERLLLLRQVIR